MLKYNCLNQQIFEIDKYQIIPIRAEDRYEIMKWRNEQMYHLRQSKALTPQEQDYYFENVISKLFIEKNPQQILFSFLENNVLIGYGGIVHINWEIKSGELSFLMSTELESLFFEKYWSIFLNLIEQVAFNDLKLFKIYTYAFDLRPKLYKCLEKSKFKLENIIENVDNRILIHSKFNERV